MAEKQIEKSSTGPVGAGAGYKLMEKTWENIQRKVRLLCICVLHRARPLTC